MHPCCSGSLQTGTKVIAILQLVGSILFIILGILGLTVRDDAAAKQASRKFALIVASIFLLVFGIISLLTSIVLLTGAIKRNRAMCMIWFVLTAIALPFSLISIVNGFICGEPWFGPVARIFGFVVQSYFMWVVWAFMTELKEETERLPFANAEPKI